MHQAFGGLAHPSHALILLALALTPVGAEARTKPQIRIGYTTHGWTTQGQDPITWHSAVSPLLEDLSKGLSLSFSLHAVPNADELARKMKSGEINLGLSWALDYVQVAQKVPLKPLVGIQWHKKRTTQVVLLVRRDSGITSLKGLQGKRIGVASKDPLTKYYLQHLLQREGVRTSKAFFAAVIHKEKPKSALLATYFKQTDGCLVWRSLFEAMARLNPQLKRMLHPIVVSPAYANPLLYARSDLPRAQVKSMLTRALKLHKTIAGKQLLLTGKVEQLRLVDDAMFETTRALLRDVRAAPAKPVPPRKPRR